MASKTALKKALVRDVDYTDCTWTLKQYPTVSNPGVNSKFDFESTWSSANFIRPPATGDYKDEDSNPIPGKQVQDMIIKRIFGLENSCPELIFTLQLIIGSAAIPTLLDTPVPTDLDGMLRHMLTYYGALVHYATAKGNTISQQEFMGRVAEAKLFEGIDKKEMLYYITEGQNQFKAVQEKTLRDDEGANSKNINYRWFNLGRTFQTYQDGNPELLERVKPFIEICVAVLKAKDIELPGHLPFYLNKDGKVEYCKDFVIRMFHAARMAIPYVPETEQIVQMSLAIQLRKYFDRKEAEVHKILNYHAMIDALSGRYMEQAMAIQQIQMFLMQKWNIYIDGTDLTPTIFFLMEICTQEETHMGDIPTTFMEHHLERLRGIPRSPYMQSLHMLTNGDVVCVSPLFNHPCPFCPEQIVEMMETLAYIEAMTYQQKQSIPENEKMTPEMIKWNCFDWAYFYGLINDDVDMKNPLCPIEFQRQYIDAVILAIGWFFYTYKSASLNQFMSLTDVEMTFMDFVQPGWAGSPKTKIAPSRGSTKNLPVVTKHKSKTQFNNSTKPPTRPNNGHRRTSAPNTRNGGKLPYNKNQNAGPKGRRKNQQGATNRGGDQRQPQSKPAPQHKGTAFLNKGKQTKPKSSKKNQVAFNDVSAMGFDLPPQMAISATGGDDGDFM